jgi:hypothetical protein
MTIFAIAYFTWVTTQTIGPFGCFDKLRDLFPHDGALGMFHCLWCMAGWMGLIVCCPLTLEQGIDAMGAAFLAALLCWAVKITTELSTILARRIQNG